MKKFIALLPMKFHSERIPEKNFKNFQGKPLFYWMLETLIASDNIETVIINTDAEDTLRSYDIIENPKVLIRERKKELCGDMVSMNKVIADDIEFGGKREYIMTHTTNPLISIDTLNRAIEKYMIATNEGKDSLFTVNKFQSRFYYDDLNPINHDPTNLIRTQDLKPLYEENSCLYIFNYTSFFTTNARIGNSPVMFDTPYLESVDIDDYDSWKKAILSYQLINKDEI